MAASLLRELKSDTSVTDQMIYDACLLHHSPNPGGWTILHFAANNRDPRNARQVIEFVCFWAYSLNTHPDAFTQLLIEPDNRGNTPAHIAALEANESVLQLLLAAAELQPPTNQAHDVLLTDKSHAQTPAAVADMGHAQIPQAVADKGHAQIPEAVADTGHVQTSEAHQTSAGTQPSQKKTQPKKQRVLQPKKKEVLEMKVEHWLMLVCNTDGFNLLTTAAAGHPKYNGYPIPENHLRSHARRDLVEFLIAQVNATHAHVMCYAALHESARLCATLPHFVLHISTCFAMYWAVFSCVLSRT